MEQISIDWTPGPPVFTVSELTRRIGDMLGREFRDLWVDGEISNAKRAASGHWYFTLKDVDEVTGLEAKLQCVCFKNVASTLRFHPQDGIRVLARGRLDVYPPHGLYQLVVEALEPKGYGALQLAFEQLKAKLAREGLFDPDRKQPLPPFPQRIGIVTSPSGAAIRDLIHILTRRFPGIHIRLFPAQVQGEGADLDVVRGIEYFARTRWADVIIVGRGGGSLEDLWTFNKETVARAIANCPVPVVSAVGHETDYTIADFVADVRAPTPSAAAQLVVPERAAVLEQIATLRSRLYRAVKLRITHASQLWHRQGIDRAIELFRRGLQRRQQRVDELGFRLQGAMGQRLQRARSRWLQLDKRLREVELRLRLARVGQRLDQFHRRLQEQIRARLHNAWRRYQLLQGQLQQLSPVAILERGYAIVQDRSGRIIRQASEAPAGSELNVRLWRGRLEVIVTRASEPGP